MKDPECTRAQAKLDKEEIAEDLKRRIESDYEVKLMQESWEEEKIKFEHGFWRREEPSWRTKESHTIYYFMLGGFQLLLLACIYTIYNIDNIQSWFN